jgi:dTDP-4-dehydrorhamnose reductase
MTPRLLVTGASGQLGSYVLRELGRRGRSAVAWCGRTRGRLFDFELVPVDLGDPEAIAIAFRHARPEIVLNAGAMAGVSDCHRDPARARAVNVAGTEALVELARQTHCRLIYVSTDLVFDGKAGNYREGDSPRPLSCYGATKAQAEQAVLMLHGGLVVRVSLLFGPTLTGRPNFFDQQCAGLHGGPSLKLFEDEWRTPLSLPAAATALVELSAGPDTGILHVGGPERLSRLEMGERLARHLGVGLAGIRASRREEVPAPEPRPRDTSLDSGRWRGRYPNAPWPTFEAALQELLPGSNGPR